VVQRVTHLDVHRTAFVIALCGAIVGLFFAVSVVVYTLFSIPRQGGAGFSIFGGGTSLLLMPLYYFLFAYIFAAVGVVVFNAVAGWMGGIPVTFAEEVGEGV
jgi:hypothetical protein